MQHALFELRADVKPVCMYCVCALNRAKIVTMHVPAELAVHDFIYISKPHPEKTILELKFLFIH